MVKKQVGKRLFCVGFTTLLYLNSFYSILTDIFKGGCGLCTDYKSLKKVQGMDFLYFPPL